MKAKCSVKNVFMILLLLQFLMSLFYIDFKTKTEKRMPVFRVKNSETDTRNVHRDNKQLSISAFPNSQCFGLSWSLSEELTPLLDANATFTVFNKSGFFRHKSKREDTICQQQFCKVAETQHGICARFLTKTGFVGRLGNNLFQYSALLGLACEYDYIPIIQNSTSYVQKYFDIPNVASVTFKAVKTLHCIGRKPAVYYNCSKELQKLGEGVYAIPTVRGLQSWKYFSKCSSTIRESLKLKQRHVMKAKQFISEHANGWNTTVCLHVRRGDITHKKNKKRGYVVEYQSYISRAQEFFLKIYPNVIFIVVSDDIGWCKKHLKGNLTFSDFVDPGDDMALMASCDHMIVTSGTFGWWGAWLSNGTTVYFRDYLRKNSPRSQETNVQDHFPPQWIPM